MFASWLPLTIVAGLASAGFNTANRKYLRDGQDSTVYAWIFELLRTIGFAALIPFNAHITWSLGNGLLLLALGLSELVSVFFFMKMHSHTELSVSASLAKLRIVLVPLIAYFALSEHLRAGQYVGILIVFIGCLLVAPPRKGAKIEKGAIYALLFSFTNAVSSVILKEVTTFASTAIATFAFSLPAALLMPLLMKQGGVRIKNNWRLLIQGTVIATIFSVLSMYSQVEALRLGRAGQVLGVFNGVATLSVVIGIYFLGEHEHKWNKLAGAVITTIGILLLI